MYIYDIAFRAGLGTLSSFSLYKQFHPMLNVEKVIYTMYFSINLKIFLNILCTDYIQSWFTSRFFYLYEQFYAILNVEKVTM